MEEYITILKNSNGFYEEKRSTFYATAFHCETAADAAEYIASVKSNNRDARHVVYAYALKNNNLNKSSDDGEPHGTAGKPVMDVIIGAGLLNTGIVVVRYFGGILLGTGGLVRAYSAAAKNAVDCAEITCMCYGYYYKCKCSYTQYSALQRLLTDIGGCIHNTEFTSGITVEFLIPYSLDKKLKTKISDIFSGELTLDLQKELFFAKK